MDSVVMSIESDIVVVVGMLCKNSQLMGLSSHHGDRLG